MEQMRATTIVAVRRGSNDVWKSTAEILKEQLLHWLRTGAWTRS